MTPSPLSLSARAALAAVALATAPSAWAAPGTPDPTFGTAGVLPTSALPFVAEDGSSFDDLGVLRDGTIQIQGHNRCSMDCRDQTLSRLSPQGASRGFVRFSIVDEDDDIGPGAVGALALPDGGLVAGFSGWPDGTPPSVRVLDRDGTVVARGDQPFVLTPMAVDPAGRILGFRGTLGPGRDIAGPGPYVLVRLGADLLPDATFGASGVVLPPELPRVADVAVDRSGVVWVAGWDDGAIVVARLDSSGSLLGITRVPVSTRTTNGAVASRLILRHGRTFIAGLASPAASAAPATVVVALRSDGARDRRFDRDGILRTRLGDVAVTSDGRVVVAGVLNPAPTATPGRARLVVRGFTAAGRPDPRFPVRLIRTAAPTLEPARVALDRRQRVVIAAPSTTLVGATGVLARILTR